MTTYVSQIPTYKQHGKFAPLITKFLVVFTTTLSIALFFNSTSTAKVYNLAKDSTPLLGKITYINAETDDSPASIGQRYDVGVNAIIAANPGTNKNTIFAQGSTVRIASSYLLPNQPQKGIVINLPEMRLYYYEPHKKEVMTFPIGIGKIGNTIPIKKTFITRKVKNPTWTPPPSIIKYNKKRGITLPKVMKAGPDNPLGPYGIYLGIPTYLIHSTIYPESIGKRASFGCIRMNENDIEQFFSSVKNRTQVAIINQPNKVAWAGKSLFLESHPPLQEHRKLPNAGLNGVLKLIKNNLKKNKATIVNWQIIAALSAKPDGIPHEVGVILSTTKQ